MRFRISPPAVWPASMAAVVFAVSLTAASDPIALTVNGRANATPAIAADGPFVVVAWGGAQASGATDVFASVSRDGGRAFGTPVRVNNVDGDARLNGEQPPQVALVRRAGREPAIVIVWTTKGAKGTTLLQSRSDDGGRSFTPASLVPGTDAAGNRGWEAIAVEPGGRVDAIWLDHRDLAASEDKWALEGCPDDGPAMAVDGQNRTHVVWPTLVTDATAESAETSGSVPPAQRASRLNVAAEPNIALFYAMSTDGKQFTARERIPTEGVPHHPRIVVAADGTLTVAWDESANGLRQVAIGRGTADDSGRLRFRRELLRPGGPGVYPVLAVAGDGVVAAWTSSGSTESSIQVARLAMNIHPGTKRIR